MNEPYGGYSHEQRGQIDGYGQPYETGPVDQWGRYNPHGPNAYMPAPNAYGPRPNQSAIAALIFGLGSIPMMIIIPPLALPLGIAGIVSAIKGISNSLRLPGRKGMEMAIPGLLASILTTLIMSLMLTFFVIAIYDETRQWDESDSPDKGPESSSESILERSWNRDGTHIENT
nr:Uncharacterised protein [Streptococcus thermophilus]